MLRNFKNYFYHSVIHTKLKGITMLRPLGFYLSLGISHNFPRKMRPKMVVPQEERGDDVPTP